MAKVVDTLILGYLQSIVNCVLKFLGSKHGGGQHQWDIQLKDFIEMLYIRCSVSMLSLSD